MRFTSPISVLFVLGLAGFSLAQGLTPDLNAGLEERKVKKPSTGGSTTPSTGGSQAACKRSFDEFSKNDPGALFARASRCGQFCSNSADCTDPTCPLCAHSNGACEWQKSCRART
ncbi:hypothetical protein Daus18300_000604 [Diaporthe australafricana]|uniref:Uncharacterized protein n=1 Tax=Diaporthe australafricana TaxID=127596 RepID=A0ABR3Y3S9_9PEZI